MFSIGEFARLGGVSVRTFRHYDEIGLLRPAMVDPGTGYRGYSAQQLGQLNRIMALKDLGLSLTQARRLLDGITLDELRGVLLLRRAQLEHELEQHKNQLLGVEGRLGSIAREGAMPADDIVAKTIPAMGVVVIAGQAPAFGPENIVPVVNQLAEQFDQLGIQDRVKEAGPRLIFYEYGHGENVTVYLALPVAEAPGELPAPAQYRVLPQIEAASTVRSGPAASIFPMIYHDLVRWIDERGYQAAAGPGREVWVNEVRQGCLRVVAKAELRRATAASQSQLGGRVPGGGGHPPRGTGLFVRSPCTTGRSSEAYALRFVVTASC